MILNNLVSHVHSMSIYEVHIVVSYTVDLWFYAMIRVFLGSTKTDEKEEKEKAKPRMREGRVILISEVATAADLPHGMHMV